jgi:S-DNA-T family DNA segregation ATPase FtsK/SpoIIIE
MAVVPLLMGVGWHGDFLHQVYLLAMAALSPVMLLGSHFSERKHGRKSHTRSGWPSTASTRPGSSRTPGTRWMPSGCSAALCPDPAAVLSIASGPRRRLWERRRSDPDYLLLRVGDRRPAVSGRADRPEQDEHRGRCSG